MRTIFVLYIHDGVLAKGYEIRLTVVKESALYDPQEAVDNIRIEVASS